MGYTKLFQEILLSTIWREPDHVRILWITMLALRNKKHIVEASLPGLADAAKITIQECEEGLKILKSPDPYSRSKNDEGRRILETEEGWFLINGEKWRQKLSVEDRNEYQRIKQREYRQKDKSLQNSKRLQNSTRFTQEETEKEKETETEINISSEIQKGGVGGDFQKFWNAYPKKKSKGNAERAWRALGPDEQLIAKILQGIERARKTADWCKEEGQFIPYPASWLRARGWEDEVVKPKSQTTAPFCHVCQKPTNMANGKNQPVCVEHVTA